MSKFVSRLTVVSLMAAFVLTTGFAAPSFAESKKERLERHRAETLARREAMAQPGYYGAPPSYYPAPPFPFFLLPGPWWLPAHP